MVSTSTVGILWFVDQMSSKQQAQQVFGGLLGLTKPRIIADKLDPIPVSKLLGIPVSISPIDDADINWIDRQRLIHGQSLISSNDQGNLDVITLLETDQKKFVVTGQFNAFRTSLIRGAFTLIKSNLKISELTLSQMLEKIRSQQKLNVRILTEQERIKYLPNITAPETIDYHGHYDINGNQGRFYSYFPTADKVVEIGPLVFNQTSSIESILVVMFMAIMLTGIAVYWLVYRFEIGLQKLERASARVASGHLSSRVKVESQDAVGRLGNSFNKMAEQIQHLMGVQKEMIRAVSHELRTPVARMRFGIQMLEDTAEDAYLQKQLQDMDQDLQELDELVDEILTYARLEEGGPVLDFKETNILELIEQVADETKRRTDKVAVSCHSLTAKEEEIFCNIEYRYMHRAVQNLVGNACRYAKNKVHIEYSFSDDICRIDIEDDGEGIPEKDWDRVFSPFTRLDDSRTRSSGGYGLGLSIVQRIIYWHGGRALVGKSRQGGAKMSLLWPKNNQSKPS